MIPILPGLQRFSPAHDAVLQRLLHDLQDNPEEYLRHADTAVASYANWTFWGYKLQAPLGSIKPESNAHLYLARLYQRLTVLTQEQDSQERFTPSSLPLL